MLHVYYMCFSAVSVANANSSPQQQPTSSADLLADLFTSPPAAAVPSANGDLLSGLSTNQQQQTDDSSQDLFKVFDSIHSQLCTRVLVQ